ncbi:MAG TPA: hypothetical protein VGS19_14650 [Streptosporangiaceae bacterium]|nr:hypothetical protein [Streptosporangiaceae bacterium]
MTTTRELGQEVQTEVLKTVRKSQEAVIDAIKTWADTVRSIMPPQLELSAPLADKLPKPDELVANAYDFAEKLLASQRKFAEEVLQATAPLLPGKNSASGKTSASTAK